MKYKSFILASVLGLTLLTTSCRDEFADINTDQSKITEANVPYLYTQAQIEFKPADYLFWFYNGSYTTKFVQAYVPTGGFKSDFNKMGATGDQGSQVIKVLRLVRDIDFTLSKMERKDAATYTQLRATLDPLLVFLGLFDTDLYGDMPFTEAAMAKYTNPMLLTPKYDHVSDLYSLWLTMLDNSLDKFLNKPAEAQASISSQDIIYKGDMAKWAKLTNSLKLKIAVRLLNQDKAKALKIAEEVAKSSAGVLDGASDDFLFNKATESSNTDQVYNFGDEVGCIVW